VALKKVGKRAAALMEEGRSASVDFVNASIRLFG
jgi:hypothetical protein